MAQYFVSLVMENTQTILDNHSAGEKAAYLTAIASIATADRQASEEELESLTALCESAGLTEESKASVLHAAGTTDVTSLQQSLDLLQKSDLKYALVTDLIAFAKLDSDYTPEEQESVQKIASYLGVNENQFSLLGEVADKTQEAVAETPASAPQSLGSLPSLGGLGDKLKNAGINTNGLLKGLLAVAAPLILSRVMNRGGRNINRGGLGGMFGGGGMGNMGGGLGGMLGGGAIGSVISMLNGGRGFGGAGNILGQILGNRNRR